MIFNLKPILHEGALSRKGNSDSTTEFKDMSSGVPFTFAANDEQIVREAA